MSQQISNFDVVRPHSYTGPTAKVFSGKVWYVGNSTVIAPGAVGGSDANPGDSPQQPFSTLVKAIGQCVANRGDAIYVLPGHSENVATAAAIALNVAGVQVIGIGKGAKRPTLNTTATGSTITMSAANTSFENILFTNGIDAVVSNVVVSAADCGIYNCEFRSVTGDAVVSVLTTAGATRLEIAGCRFIGSATATATAYIALVGGANIQIHHCYFNGQASVGFIDCRTTATTDLEVHDCMMRSLGAGEVFLKDTITASTGTIGPNIYCRLSANAANITEAITGATFVVFDNVYVVNAANEKAMLINWTASTDA